MKENFRINISKNLIKLKNNDKLTTKTEVKSFLKYVNIGGSKGKLTPLDSFKTVVSINWGPNHCIFVD